MEPVLIATVARASRTEEACGRGKYVAMIRRADGGYVAHRYGNTIQEATTAAERFGASVRPRTIPRRAAMLALDSGTVRIGAGNTESDMVSAATRSFERLDGFSPMAGHTIAQTVAMKIDGFHAPRDGAHDIRKSPEHIWAVY